jgi:hypothetical protein
MSWYEILAIISKLTELDKFTVESCASALGCQFEPTTPNRYRADALQNPFNFAELISGSDKTILILTLKSESAREEFAMRMHSLGKPIDIDVVSPPIADGNHPGTHSVWERKYSLCYEIGDCPVWFGIEEVNSQKNLVNVTIYRHQ